MSGMGSAALRRYRKGSRLTPVQAIRAKCAECTCDFGDGRVDCAIPGCPLYPWQPYGEAKTARARRGAKSAPALIPVTPQIAPTSAPRPKSGVSDKHPGVADRRQPS
jgi:hypothetical protein